MVCATSQVFGLVLVNQLNWVLVVACSSWMYCFQASPSWSSGSHHGDPNELEMGSCSHTQQLGWFLCWAFFAGHCRREFISGAHPVTKHHRSNRSLRLKRHYWDFPGGPGVKNPPTSVGNTVRSGNWDPTCRRATETLAPRACALQQDKPSQWEAHALQLERVALSCHN